MTIQQFIKANGVTMQALAAANNPNMTGMGVGSKHWFCVLSVGLHHMPVYFSQGSGHKKQPTLADVLDCLASDASSVEGARGFDDWSEDLGYGKDSLSALKTYETIKVQAAELSVLLGKDAIETLMYKIERL